MQPTSKLPVLITLLSSPAPSSKTLKNEEVEILTRRLKANTAPKVISLDLFNCPRNDYDFVKRKVFINLCNALIKRNPRITEFTFFATCDEQLEIVIPVLELCQIDNLVIHSISNVSSDNLIRFFKAIEKLNQTQISLKFGQTSDDYSRHIKKLPCSPEWNVINQFMEENKHKNNMSFLVVHTLAD